MEDNYRCILGRLFLWRRMVMTSLCFLVIANGSPANAGDRGADFAWTGAYAGAFAGYGRTDNRIVDVDGFANWGNPGSSVDYDNAGLVGGVLAGKKFDLYGERFRIEIDGTFGNMSAGTNRLDPTCSDEAAESELQWVATVRAGVEQQVGRATVFASGGLAAARIVNSVTDTDYSGSGCLERELRLDADDSFRNTSTETGWVIGVGVEAPLTDDWTLRLDGSYLDFGRNTYYVNQSGNNTCGRGGAQMACPYNVENRFGIARLAIIYRFGG